MDRLLAAAKEGRHATRDYVLMLLMRVGCACRFAFGSFTPNISPLGHALIALRIPSIHVGQYSILPT